MRRAKCREIPDRSRSTSKGPDMSDPIAPLEDLRRRVAEACRVLGHLHLTQGTVGHASARLPGAETFLIRARGPAENGVRFTQEPDIIEVTLEGQRVASREDGYSVPLEVHIHTALYQARPEVNAVVHMHPRKLVLMSICDKPIRPIYGAFDPLSLRLVMGGIPTYPSSLLIDRAELGVELAEAMGEAPVCVMRGHGLTTAANSVEEAALVAIQTLEIAEMNYDAELLGGASDIPQEEQAVFRAMDVNTGYGAFKLGEPSGRAANLWRYYKRIAEGP